MLSTILAASSQNSGLLELFVLVRPWLIGVIVLSIALYLLIVALFRRWDMRDLWSPMTSSFVWAFWILGLLFLFNSYRTY